MKKPIISVIIPSRNEEKYIENCLKSIKAQSVPNEIIVADRSEDRTAKISKKYGKVVKETRKGPAIARNTGAKIARGSILVFADADVRFPRGCFKKILKEFEKDIGGCVFNLVPWDAKTSREVACFKYYNKFIKFLINHKKIMTNGSCFAYTKEVFTKAGGFNPKLLTSEDHEMAKKASKIKPFIFADIDVKTSLRRSQKLGTLGFIAMHAKSIFNYLVLKKSYKGYWD